MSLRRSNALLKHTAPVFAALGDETRLRLLARLSADGPQSITRLANGTEVTRQAISKHLHVLAEAGLVRGTRSGRERLYELELREFERARRALDEISEEWDRALGRLKALVER